MADEQRAAIGVEVCLVEHQRFADPKSCAPQHNDHAAQPDSLRAVAAGAHDGDDLVHGRRIRRVAEPLVPRRHALMKAGRGRWRPASTGAIEQWYGLHDVLLQTTIDRPILAPSRPFRPSLGLMARPRDVLHAPVNDRNVWHGRRA
jgi:hypothetical protein